ncbi:extracellular solute-binding protein [Butyrivibrio sp. MC2013]|uniref:extracellular solute-binding protein n=1 Tax=Butyrivibrio sp. MC2013 TaxID=1280686 RepID=UPI0004051F51|nr:extracellular solute-binding protein [Butyrivibrio sp. MC2013]
MKRKKVLALVMASMMAFAAGCSSSGTESASSGEAQSAEVTADQAAADETAEVQDITLKVWTPEEDMDITNDMCAAFDEAHPEYNITFDISITGIDESGASLTTDADAAADVFLIPSGSIPELTNAGLLLPIAYDLENVKSLYGEGAIEACTKDDMLYGIPSSPNSFFMYYNKDMYTEEEVKSLDAMMAKDLGADVKNFSFTIHNSWYLESFFYAAGCTLFGEDGTDPTDCTWNNENGIKAGEYVLDLIANPKYLEDEDGIAGSMMKDGKLAALCSGTWASNDVKEALGDAYAAAPLPTIKIDGKDCQLSNFADYKCYAVKSSTAQPLAAQQLAEFFANEENQLVHYKNNGQTPTVLSLQENPEIAADPATVALIGQTQYATPQPSIAQIANYWSPVEALGTGMVNGEVTKDNLQEMLDSTVTGILDELTAE